MEWWQILVAALVFLGIGILLGVLLDYLLKPLFKKREATLEVKEQPKYTMFDLVEEIKHDCKIATEPWAGKLLPFQTRVWDALQGEVGGLPTNLRQDLAQVYVDISLANSIVRLSTEFNHRTHDLDESYMKVCAIVAEMLERIKPLIEGLEK